jgi:cation diffusion facilitator family transporter
MAHSHSQGGNEALLDARGERARAVRRVTWGALFANVTISAAKLAAGLAGGSQAVVADAVHSASDSVTDVAILVGVKYWSAPADETHPHGHGRIETLVSAGIGLVLVAVAGGIVWHAIETLPEGHQDAPGWVAFAAAVTSLLGKEILYRWTVAVGRRIKSPALVANAWHHRSDGLSSVPAALAVLAVRLLGRDWAFIDHVGAVVVSLFILRAAWKITRPAFRELIDSGAPEEDLRRIREVAEAVDGVDDVHGLRTRYSGPGLLVDLHVRVDGAMSVRRGHDISEEVKSRLLAEGPDVIDVVVHLEPRESGSGVPAAEDSGTDS